MQNGNNSVSVLVCLHTHEHLCWELKPVAYMFIIYSTILILSYTQEIDGLDPNLTCLFVCFQI